MINVSTIKHHPILEELVDIICTKTSNEDRSFFNVEVAYFLAKIAGSMRAFVRTKDRGDIPVNLYVIALAPSGSGKGHSMNFMEHEVLYKFEDKFVNDLLPAQAEHRMWEMVENKSIKQPGIDEETEFNNLEARYNSTGEYYFTFDSGTVPAIKQIRQKLLYAKCGALNLQIDEIGSNLSSSNEILPLFLELYDQGYAKPKLIKNQSDAQRDKELKGKTPANMLLFGTPAKLFDGDKTEDNFYSLLQEGFARRCLFGMSNKNKEKYYSMTPEKVYETLIDDKLAKRVQFYVNHFESLADDKYFHRVIVLPDDVAIELIAYKMECEKEADKLPEHMEIQKAELTHRYFKVLKLAGAYAFVDKANFISSKTLKQAIKLIEESGQAFTKLLTREKPYMKLAKYICSIDMDVSHSDLMEALPFYKGSSNIRNDLINLAMSWAYGQHLLIKKVQLNGIDFFRGETLKETSLDSLIFSCSDHEAYRYESVIKPIEDFVNTLLQTPNYHWINHHVKENHRAEAQIIPGFNIITLDVDEGISLEHAKELMQEYYYVIYTTKRHSEENNRFRLILFTNYELYLDNIEYKEFMKNLFTWLPFKVDPSCDQRSKKWLTNPGNIEVHEGKLLDVLPFIPRTKKNEEFKASLTEISSMDNLERWFYQRMDLGNRNNYLYRYALMLKDSGLGLETVEDKILAFNNNLINPLPEEEIQRTIFKSLESKY